MTALDGTTAARRGWTTLRLTATLTLGGLSLAACATAPAPAPQQFMVSRVPATGFPPSAPAAKSAPPSVAASPAARPQLGPLIEARTFPRGGRYKIGSPYRIAGVRYVPADQPDYDRVGIASWYGDEFHGRKTANGERFNMYTASAAHTTLPLPSIVEVTNLANGRSIRVRLNDRGPYVNGRIIDLSRDAADELGYRAKGLARVRVRYIGPARMDDSLTPLYVARTRREDQPELRFASADNRESPPLVQAPDRQIATPPARSKSGRMTLARADALPYRRALYPLYDADAGAKLPPLW